MQKAFLPRVDADRTWAYIYVRLLIREGETRRISIGLSYGA